MSQFINGQAVTVTVHSGTDVLGMQQQHPLGLRERHALEIMDVIVRHDETFLTQYWRYELHSVTVLRDAPPGSAWCLLRYVDDGRILELHGHIGKRSFFDLEARRVTVSMPG